MRTIHVPPSLADPRVAMDAHGRAIAVWTEAPSEELPQDEQLSQHESAEETVKAEEEVPAE